MAQHDYVIENQTFPATRTDINNALGAVVSTNAGATAPSTTYAHQLWYDTTANKLKQRNADNDAWIDLFDVDQTADTAEPSQAVAGGAGYFQGENGATGDTTNGKGDIFRVHEQQLDTDTTIASGDNAGAFFSLTVATGVTLTVNGNLVVA
jgi:hypothetical protein